MDKTWIGGGNVKVGSTVKFWGRVLYTETSSVKYVLVKLKLNSKLYNLNTDGADYLRLYYTATVVGTFTFTSTFAGNDLYLSSTNSTNFTVVKL